MSPRREVQVIVHEDHEVAAACLIRSEAAGTPEQGSLIQ